MNFENRFKSLMWTSDINQELPIKLTAHEGPGSEVPKTLSSLFLEKCALFKDEICLSAIKEIMPENKPKDNKPVKPTSLKIMQYTW